MRPDPLQVLAANDMNSWSPGKPPMLFALADGGRYQLYRASFDATKALAGGRIRFGRIAGKAEFWLNGALLRKKDAFGESEFSVSMPAGQGAQQLTVIVRVGLGQRGGIEGSVLAEPRN
jgi:beta-galactosidase